MQNKTKIKKYFIAPILVLLIVLIFGFSAASSSPLPGLSLFTSVNEEITPSRAPNSNAERGLNRSLAVSANRSALARLNSDLFAPGRLNPGDQLIIEAFDQKMYNVGIENAAVVSK